MTDPGSHSTGQISGRKCTERGRARSWGSSRDQQGAGIVALPFGCTLFSLIVFVSGALFGLQFHSSVNIRLFIKCRLNKQESVSQVTPEKEQCPELGGRLVIGWLCARKGSSVLRGTAASHQSPEAPAHCCGDTASGQATIVTVMGNTK